jgi:phosphatidylglycerophosphate synthase
MPCVEQKSLIQFTLHEKDDKLNYNILCLEVRETNDITFVIVTVIFIALIILLCWFAYRKADGNIVTLLRWGRNVTAIEMLASFIIWLVKSSNTGTYFDPFLFLNALVLLFCFISLPIYKKFQGQYESKGPSMEKLRRPFGYNKYALSKRVPHFASLSLSGVLLLNIWNVCAFLTKYVFIHR